MNTTEWFVYINEEKNGPFSTQQIIEKIQQKTPIGKILPHSRIWKKGMATWAPIHSVDEFKTYFAPKKSKIAELSALFEVNPNEVDDRTNMIDPSQLKKARKEAIQIEKQIRKSKSKGNSLGRFVILIVLLGIAYFYFSNSEKPNTNLIPAPSATPDLTPSPTPSATGF